MIHITENKLRAAIQIALVGECENADKTEDKLMRNIKALSIPDVGNPVKIALLKQLEEISDYMPAEIYTRKVIEIKEQFL